MMNESKRRYAIRRNLTIVAIMIVASCMVIPALGMNASAIISYDAPAIITDDASAIAPAIITYDHKWAVIILGQENNGQPGGDLTVGMDKTANTAFMALKNHGYSEANILYLAPAARDPDNDGVSEVDLTSTRTNIYYAFDTWLHGNSGTYDKFWVYVIAHGGEVSGDSRFTSSDGLVVAESVLAPKINACHCYHSIIAMEHCNCGSWASSLNIANRILVTGCQAYPELCWVGTSGWIGAYFGQKFFEKLNDGWYVDGIGTGYSAFTEGYNCAHGFHGDQHAQIYDQISGLNTI